jgi:type II secretory pathway pseudopilin PulG
MKLSRKPNGFTLVDMVTALLIGGILVTIALTSVRTAQGRFAVRNARTMYATLHQRARARSVEMGETVLFFVDTAGDSAFILTPSSGLSDVTRFRSQLNVDLRGPNYMMCMTPRGYADYNCGSYGGMVTATSSSTIRLQFWQNADSTSVLVLPMGQLVGL